jgi:hypothetical protein
MPVLRLGLYFRTGSAIRVSLEPHSAASFEIPMAVVDGVASQLCSSLFLIRTVHRTLAEGTGRPWINSSTPVLANLTTIQLCTVCNNQVKEVRGIANLSSC